MSVADRLDVAVVGAGPFGLSIAAHLQHRAVRTFGREMATWRERMPAGMLMRSDWHETSLSAPGRAGAIDEWVARAGGQRVEPIPLELFLRYAAWFAETFVAERDPNDVVSVEPTSRGSASPAFRLSTAAGAEVDASAVVIAVGVMPFAYVPPALAQGFGREPTTVATWDPNAMEGLAGRRLMIIGAGQSGLEAAGMAAQAGASVELVSRSNVHWFRDREPYYPRSLLRQRLYRAAYPAVGYGPPVLNRVVLHPDLFAMLPDPVRAPLARRLVRAGGSAWVRTLVEGRVDIVERCTVESLEERDGGFVVGLSNGSTREVDDILVACGFRFDLERLQFLSPEIRAGIAVEGSTPRLDRFFRSSNPGLFFVGYAAEARFGPLCRFVLGTEFTATRVASVLGG